MSNPNMLCEPTREQYAELAWLLRSQPKWLRKQMVVDWGIARMLPREEPDDVDACMSALAAVVRSLIATFDEWAKEWQDWDYFSREFRAPQNAAR